MRYMSCVMVALATAALVALGSGRTPAESLPRPSPFLKVNKEYDKRTQIRPSTIPGAGNGLFALVKIAKGEVVGELGGRLIREENYPQGNHYIASLSDCAARRAHPHKYIDAKDHGAPVSRINFAPREINGIPTNLQNAAIKRTCRSPYVIFVAIQDIEPGTEILSSYGPYYDYDRFMHAPEVRDFFCGLIKIDCSEKYSFAH